MKRQLIGVYFFMLCLYFAPSMNAQPDPPKDMELRAYITHVEKGLQNLAGVTDHNAAILQEVMDEVLRLRACVDALETYIEAQQEPQKRKEEPVRGTLTVSIGDRLKAAAEAATAKQTKKG